MEWSCADCLRLIREYQLKRLLWNPGDEYYFSKNKKREAWEEIGKSLNKNVEEVKKKASSLLGSFRRERARAKTVTGQKFVYTSKWFAFDAFQFLLDRDDLRSTFNTDNDDINELINTQDSTDCESTQEHVEEINDVQLQENFDVWSREEENGKRSLSISGQTPIKKKKTQAVSDKCLEEAIEILKQPFSTITTPDECSVYGQHVANKLRTYSSRTRSIVQYYINNILFEADMGKYDTNSSHILKKTQCSNVHSSSTTQTTSSQKTLPLSSPNHHYEPFPPDALLVEIDSSSFKNDVKTEPNDAAVELDSFS